MGRTRWIVTSVALAALALATVRALAHAAYEDDLGSGRADDTLRVDLSQAYRMALEGSFGVRSAQAHVERAHGNRLTVTETLLPSISPVLRFTKHRDLLQNTEGAFLDVDKQSARSAASLLLSWRPSEIIFHRAAAAAEVAAAAASATNSRREALWEAARRYVALASSEESVETAEHLLGILEQVAGQVQARVRLGLGSELDQLRLLAQVEQQRQAVARARVEREAAQGQLAVSLGQSPSRPVKTAGLAQLPVTEPATFPGAVAEALSRRADLTAARATASSARHTKKSWSYGRLLPDLGAEVSPGYLGPNFADQRSTYDASFFLSWTLGPGGWLDPGRLETTSSEVELADIRVREVEARIVAEVREAYAAASTATELETAADSAATLADRALKLTRERDQRGLAAPYELVQATEAWLRSSSDLIRERAEVALARIRLDLVLERGEP